MSEIRITSTTNPDPGSPENLPAPVAPPDPANQSNRGSREERIRSAMRWAARESLAFESKYGQEIIPGVHRCISGYVANGEPDQAMAAQIARRIADWCASASGLRQHALAYDLSLAGVAWEVVVGEMRN